MPKTKMPNIIFPAPYRVVPTLAVTFVATVAFTASIALADDRPSGPPRQSTGLSTRRRAA